MCSMYNTLTWCNFSANGSVLDFLGEEEREIKYPRLRRLLYYYPNESNTTIWMKGEGCYYETSFAKVGKECSDPKMKLKIICIYEISMSVQQIYIIQLTEDVKYNLLQHQESSMLLMPLAHLSSEDVPNQNMGSFPHLK